MYTSDTADKFIAARNLAIICAGADGGLFKPDIYSGTVQWKWRELSIMSMLTGDEKLLIKLYGSLGYPTMIDSSDAERSEHATKVKIWWEDMKRKGACEQYGPIPYNFKNSEHGYPAEPQRNHVFASPALEELNTKIPHNKDDLESLSRAMQREVRNEIARREQWKKTTNELSGMTAAVCRSVRAAMARITQSRNGTWIDSGPITATSKLDEVPEKNWYNLMCQREMFVKARLSQDCRCLVQFVADADRMYGPLGFKNADDFIAHGLKLVPAEIRLAVDWLKINKPQEAIPIKVVHKLAGHGGDRRSKRAKDQVDNINSKNKGGTSRSYLIARLKRDRPDLAEKVIAGEVSANAAAIQAGFRKKATSRCPKCGHEW